MSATVRMGAGSCGRGLSSQYRSWVRRLQQAALAWCAGGLFTLAGAQGVAQFGGSAPDRPVGPPQRSVAEWLVRLQQAAQLPSYMGTFVVSSASGAMSSSRIWHVCEGDVQMERVEALTGVPRSTFRRNESVVTFLPEARIAKLDQREAGGVFPNLLSAGHDFPTADFYAAREHVAGASQIVHGPFPALELFAEELRLAQQALGQITGEFTADDLLGVIFSRFCIGK